METTMQKYVNTSLATSKQSFEQNPPNRHWIVISLGVLFLIAFVLAFIGVVVRACIQSSRPSRLNEKSTSFTQRSTVSLNEIPCNAVELEFSRIQHPSNINIDKICD